MQWHQLDHVQTICTSLQTDNNIDTSSVNSYRLDALPDAQPTVSKTEGKSPTLKLPISKNLYLTPASSVEMSSLTSLPLSIP